MRPARTDAEWARETSRRIESVENPTSQRIGPWVLSASADGHLIASHVEGGSTILARKPSGGENDPDAISDLTPPAVTVTCTALQTISGANGTIMWDGAADQVGGNWTGGKKTFDAVMVPVSGVYDIAATVWFSAGNAFLTAAVMVNGETRVAGRIADGSGTPWPSVTVAGQLPLQAGDAVSLFAEAAGTSRNVGAAPIFAQPIPTSMSLSLVSRS
ncbi:hypothetical protein D5S18_22080 [Nocardia panacis]|uniref:Uncharacterized protein n=1 Tax=Nocardia panacis TaxID=2340916 RepID=A0A3A4KF93_9NOCA|nr:hypothetical protein D5S18_22080 [Nocardia panacis]